MRCRKTRNSEKGCRMRRSDSLDENLRCQLESGYEDLRVLCRWRESYCRRTCEIGLSVRFTSSFTPILASPTHVICFTPAVPPTNYLFTFQGTRSRPTCRNFKLNFPITSTFSSFSSDFNRYSATSNEFVKLNTATVSELQQENQREQRSNLRESEKGNRLVKNSNWNS